jgi:SAM-dependent methyltransferase
MKFLPPYHLLPYELNDINLKIGNMALIKPKADGLNVTEIPNFNFKYDIVAEYLEQYDIYLVYDIIIPEMNKIERYEYLRKLHPLTYSSYEIQTISLEKLDEYLKEENIIFSKFLQTRKINWYPKISYQFELNQNNLNIIRQLSNSLNLDNINCIYNIDGFIITPLNGDREIKIKPKNEMTVDLIFKNNDWYSNDVNIKELGINIINHNNLTFEENQVWRCYPNSEQDYYPKELRKDKYRSNPPNIVKLIYRTYLHDFESENKVINKFRNIYYSINNSYRLNFYEKKHLETIDNKLEEILEDENFRNKKVLDLGCGKGKLLYKLRFSNIKKYYGLDLDIDNLVKTNYLIGKFKINGYTDLYDLNEMKSYWNNMDNDKYDYIFLNFSLSHFNQDLIYDFIKYYSHKNTKIIISYINDNITKFDKNNKYKVSYNLYLCYDEFKKKVFFRYPWLDNIKSENLVDENKLYNNFNIKKINVFDIYTTSILTIKTK